MCINVITVVEIYIVTGGIQYIYTVTRKYPLRGYIFGVLVYTTALDRLWGGAETLKWQFYET